MLLKKYGKQLSGKTRLVIGQMTLTTGILITLITRHWSDAIPDVPEGFLVGMSAVLLGVSIVFNLSTLPRVKQRFNLDD